MSPAHLSYLIWDVARCQYTRGTINTHAYVIPSQPPHFPYLISPFSLSSFAQLVRLILLHSFTSCFKITCAANPFHRIGHYFYLSGWMNSLTFEFFSGFLHLIGFMFSFFAVFPRLFSVLFVSLGAYAAHRCILSIYTVSKKPDPCN